MTKNKHTSLEQRIKIEKMLEARSSFSAIAAAPGKHPSTISLEIRNHSFTEKTGAFRLSYNACIHRYTCKIPRLFLCRPCNSAKKVKLCKNCGMCNAFCDKFEKDECKKLQKAPYVCNGCPVRPHCTLEKKFYRAETAHIGFSFHDTPELLDRVLTDHPEMEFVQLQINYLDWESPWIRSRECYEVARKHGLPVIVMEPVKGGTLAQVPPEVIRMLNAMNPEASAASWAVRFAASLSNVNVLMTEVTSLYLPCGRTTLLSVFHIRLFA